MPLTQANIVQDQVRDAGITKQYTLQGLLSFAQIDRASLVTGLSAAGVTGDTATAAVLALMQQMTPIGTPHPTDGQCAARYYGVRPVESDDALQGVVSYVFNTPGGDATDWTIQSDSDLDVQTTDVEYNLSNGALQPIATAPFILGWLNPTDAKPLMPNSQTPEQPQKIQYPAVEVGKFYKTWIYTRTIYSVSAAQAFDNGSEQYVGRSNSVPFKGITAGSAAQNLNKPPGTVLCQKAGLTVSPYQGRRTAVLVLSYKPEGHDKFIEYYNHLAGGRADNLWRASAPGVTPAFDANGIRQSSAIQRVDLNALLALLVPGAQLPFGGGGALPTGT